MPLGPGEYEWSASGLETERLVAARGTVTSPRGLVVTRTVQARLEPGPRGWEIAAWEETP